MEASQLKQETVIIFGPVGAGKTDITNLLTGSKFKTSNSGFSCTRQIQTATDQYNNFLVKDFPGTDAAVERVKHVKVQMDALKSSEFKALVLVCNMSDRGDDLLVKLSKIINLFSYHKDNILIVLTKCEPQKEDNESVLQAQARQSEKNDNMIFVIEQHLKIDRNRVFCKTKTTNGKQLSNWICEFFDEMETIEQGIFESDSFHELIPDINCDPTTKRKRNETEELFNKIYNSHLARYEETSNKELKRALFFSLKQYLDKITTDYVNSISEDFTNKMEISAEVIVFQTCVSGKFEFFREKLSKDLAIETYTYNGKKTEYKKCPCGEIWSRVTGCNSIICGKRSISKDFSTRFYNFIIEWVDDNLKIEEKPTDSKEIRFSDTELVGLSDNEKKMNETRGTKERELIKPRGCGRQSEWDKMEDVTEEIEKKLKEEFKVSISSEMDKIMEKVKATEIETGSLEKYNVQQTCIWLRNHGLEDLVDLFSKEKIDGKILMELSDENMKEIGITAFGDRKRLKAALGK